MDRSTTKVSQDPLKDLWAFLAAVTAPDDEQQCARLMATGIPSMIPCRVSGIAVLGEELAEWLLTLQITGRQLTPAEAKPIAAKLDRFFDECLDRGDLSEFPAGGLPSDLRDAGVHTLVAAPILTLRSRVGVLLVGKGADEEASEQDYFVLRTLAEHLAIVVENLRLHHSLERHAQQLEGLVEERTARLRESEQRHRLLLDVNNSIVANLDQASFFQATVKALRGLVSFDLAALALLDATGETIRVSARTGESTMCIRVGDEFPARGSHLQPAIERRQVHIRDDLEGTARVGHEELLLQEGMRSYVAVPLVAKDGVLGVLCLASKAQGGYTEANAQLLQDLSNQVALGVDNMRAYEEIADLKSRLQAESLYLQEEIKLDHNFDEIVGSSRGLRRTLEAVGAVAPTDSTVLILGETGTGKELIARAIHARSRRHGRALVKVNCGALPSGLVESELFGHEKGAFTGATKTRPGRFELADQGTLFLDEVGDITPETQVKLLRVLQEGEFERVGGTETLRVDVRVVAATNRNLAEAVAAGDFRSDLYYRLNVFPIAVPPLRERREDIPLLARYFADRCGAKLKKRITSLSERSLSAMQACAWPGNIRELASVVERAVIVSRGPELHVEIDAPIEGSATAPSAARGSGMPTLAEAERDHIVAALESCGGAIAGPEGAAGLLGINPSTLRSRMNKLGIRR